MNNRYNDNNNRNKMFHEFSLKIKSVVAVENVYLEKDVRNCLFKAKKSWFWGYREIIKTNHMHLKSRISRQWFTQNVF